MPRVNRSTVEFTVGGKHLTATFQHVHDEKGITDESPLRIKHITICRISNGQINLKGESKCSMRDIYKWRFGLRQAFIRALAAGGITPQSGKLYGQYMEAFFTELRKKDYAPHTPSSPATMTLPVLNGQIVHAEPSLRMQFIPTPKLTGTTPIYNQHGLGYVGA